MRWLIGIAVVVGALVLALRWDAPKEDVLSGRVVDAGRIDGLAVRGGFDSNSVSNGEVVRIWLLFHNQSDDPIHGLRFLDVKYPGFERAGTCWVEYEPACRPDGRTTRLERELQPGATALVSADIKAVGPSGRYAMQLAYGWTNPKGGAFTNAIALGPLESTTWWQLGVINISTRLKDLALPILLLAAGALLQQAQKKRDDRLRHAEDARAHRQTQTAAILNTLVERSLNDTQKFYLPLVTRVSELVSQLTKTTHDTPEQRRHYIFYALTTFLLQQKRTVDELGGIHLQDRTGERVIGRAWHYFRAHLNLFIDPELRSAALQTLSAGVTLAEFTRAVAYDVQTATPPVLGATRASVVEWIEDPGAPLAHLVPVLEVYQNVLIFEMNRPFEYWYGKREAFPVDELTASLTSLKEEVRLPARFAMAADRDERKKGMEALLEGLRASLKVYVAEGKQWNAARGSGAGS